MSKSTALITGATGGLGKEFAKIHASYGNDLILTDWNEQTLNELKQEIESEYNVKVYAFAIDLTDIDSAERVYEHIKSNNLEVDYLINNAGIGGQGEFHIRSMDSDMKIIYLNIITPTKLLKLFLPDFINRRSGKILNISSAAALTPGPLQAEYYASKAYFTSLSNSIWQEIKTSNVTITTLMPGAMNTGFVDTAGVGSTKMFKRLASPKDVAKKGYEGMLVGKMNVITGLTWWQKPIMRIISIFPRKLVLQIIYNMQKV